MSQSSQSLAIDGAAIGLSTLCIVHCLALPLLAATSPLVANLAGAEWLHRGLVLIATPISLLALSRIQGGPFTLAFGGLVSVGLSLLFLGAFVEPLHDFETVFTVCGALVLSVAHFIRWKIH